MRPPAAPKRLEKYSAKWEDFHTSFISDLRELLVSQVRPRYTVDVERHLYVTRETDEAVRIIAPDVIVADAGPEWTDSLSPGTATLRPVKYRIALPRHRQPYLVIRTRRGETVVTVIELLPPWNQSPEAGVAEYLTKRTNVLYSNANLVELDLLRGGERLPTMEPLPVGEYYAFVSRPQLRPEVDVYAWTLRDSLPSLPIPLAEDEPHAILDLQTAFTTTYDRAGYDYSLDDTADVRPPLSAATAEWVRARVTT